MFVLNTAPDREKKHQEVERLITEKWERIETKREENWERGQHYARVNTAWMFQANQFM